MRGWLAALLPLFRIVRFARPDLVGAALNLFWLALERLTQIVVAIVISGVLARYFGPADFGKWQYANTLLLVLAPLTWVCGNEILVPALVNASDARVRRVLGSAFALRFSTSLLALAATWIALYCGVLDATVAAMLAGLALTMIFREPFAVISAWLQSRTFSKPALLLSMATGFAKALIVVLLVRLSIAPAHFGWLWGAESAAIAAGLLLYFAKTHGARLGWRVEGRTLRQFASAGSVFWLGLICMYLFLKLDRLMLQHYIDYAQLGRYSAAQQLNENWSVVALMLAQTLAPAFVYRVQSEAALRRNLMRLSALTAIAMSLGACALALLAPLIVRVIFGPAFSETVGLFQWAVWISVLAGVEAIANLALLKYQARYVVLGKWLAALALSAILNLLLIPRLGAHGALISLAAGYLAAIAIDFLFVRQRLRPLPGMVQ